MVNLDDQEISIIRELVRNPRVSDNRIARSTGIPVMTVNRKRKKLEEAGLIKYYTDFDNGEDGTGDFSATQLYIVKFVVGITRDQFLSFVESNKRYCKFMAKYALESFLGEKDGRLSLIMILCGKNTNELVEVFNSTLLTMYRQHFGEHAVRDIITARITDHVRKHHNYLPLINMEKGILKDDWPDELIFVDSKSHGITNHNGTSR